MHPALITILVIIGVLAVLFGLYLFLIMTKRNKSIDKYKSVKFAHRGLHSSDIPENSMGAFSAAIDRGFGIELDVRLSRDGELVVFHDDTLLRVCSDGRRVRDVDLEELKTIALLGTEETVPSFAEVLELVGGRVPLLVEIKEDQGDSEVSRLACKMLAEYKGDYIVESFNPFSLKVVRELLPDVPRGILSMRFEKEERFALKVRNFLLGKMLTNVICRPSFIAYHNEDGGALGVRLLGGVFGAARFAWTVKSEKEESEAYERGFDSVIFEGYIPEK